MKFSDNGVAVLPADALVLGPPPDPQLKPAADPYGGVPLGVEGAWWSNVMGASVVLE